MRTVPNAGILSSPTGATTSAGASAVVQIQPAASSYLRGDASGLRLWGASAGRLTVRALDASGKPIVGSKAPEIVLTSKNPKQMIVTAESGNATFTLRAVTSTDAHSTCPACLVVSPGTAALAVTVTPQGGGKVARVTVPVTIAHKILAVSLNPFPNPSLGGADAVMQYFDDNVKPSVIWDDIVVKNATSFPNVMGMAFGGDGSLYVANSGLLGGAFGTVTKYAAGSTDPTPVQTFKSKSLMSAAAVAVDAQDNVYVGDNGLETITRFPKNGGSKTIQPGWEAGADVTGIAVDSARGQVYVTMACAGEYYPPKAVNVGRIVSLPSNFGPNSKPTSDIESSATNGVNQPYDVAIGASGQLFVVNDYVSIVQGPPGPGPEYSTLTRYDGGIASSSALPDATASKRLVWPLSVATDVAGTVYVANSTAPKNNGRPGKMYLVEYSAGFVSGAKGRTSIDLSAGMPAAYAPYYMNVEGVAVDPSPLRT